MWIQTTTGISLSTYDFLYQPEYFSKVKPLLSKSLKQKFCKTLITALNSTCTHASDIVWRAVVDVRRITEIMAI